MTDEHNESKLVPKLALKFSDYAIDTFVPIFEFKDEQGTYVKDRITVPLKVEGNKTCKGLKIRCYKTGVKSFSLSYWLNNKSLKLGCGTFTKMNLRVLELEALKS